MYPKVEVLTLKVDLTETLSLGDMDEILSKTKLLAEPICKEKIDRFSVRYRATKLFNLLSAQKLIPEDVERYSKTELLTFCQTFKTVFLVQNEELIDYIFKL